MAEIPKQLLGNLKGPQGDPGPNIVSSETGTSGFENGHVLYNDNGHVSGKKLTAKDVGARPDDWIPTAKQVGAQPAMSMSNVSFTKGPSIGTDYTTAYRYGNICIVAISQTLKAKPAAYDRNTVLFTGFPAPAKTSQGVVYNQDTGTAHTAQIDTTGTVKLIVNGDGFPATSNFLWGALVYVIAEGA